MTKLSSEFCDALVRLIWSGALVDEKYNGGRSPLAYAAAGSPHAGSERWFDTHVYAIVCLIGHGAHVFQQTTLGARPYIRQLNLPDSSQKIRGMSKFLLNNANVNSTDNFGRTSVDYSELREYSEVHWRSSYRQTILQQSSGAPLGDVMDDHLTPLQKCLRFA